MKTKKNEHGFEKLKKKYPEKILPEEEIFKHIHRGDRIFIHTGCGEPQYLIQSLVTYVENHPKAFSDAEVLSWWNLGVAPYADPRYQTHFRHNSFFIADTVRKAVNTGQADFTPVFLSKTPGLFSTGLIPIDVALIQVSPPDRHGYVSLGVSVDIAKAAVKSASIVIAQCNSHVPRIHGDGFLHINDLDFLVIHNEPILEFKYTRAPRGEFEEATSKIGTYVSSLIQDGDTIQVGYGSIPDAIMAHLSEKKHLGLHTELVSDGLVHLLKKGVIDNSRKTINKGISIASFCMGSRETYDFIHDNPTIHFRAIEYTNNPLIIAQHDRMTAVNSALQIDLTGQASSESIGKTFFSGIGGQTDFMRGATLARNGKTILTLHSTAENGTISRIVPFLPEGAGVTLNRGDIHYVVTEYGIAYIHGKNIRERAMQLISIAHPKFRPYLIEQARAHSLIYKDQAFIPGSKGEYPEHYEIWRTTKHDIEIFIRPVKISDEPLLKDFFYTLSRQSLYQRFMTVKHDIPHERLQELCVIDYTKEMVVVAAIKKNTLEKVIALGQYITDEETHTAEIAFVVQDTYQKKGIGTELLKHLTYLAKVHGLLGFTANVLIENTGMIHLFEKYFSKCEKYYENEVYKFLIHF